MRTLFRILGFVFLGLVLVTAYGFFQDDRETEAAAKAAACAGRGAKCVARLARLEKTPLWREMDLRVGPETVIVRCTRAFHLFGPHSCVVRAGVK
jgi:hypothetical protein